MDMHINVIDITRQTFGSWFVIKYVGKSKQGHAMWKCVCSCGNVKIVRGSSLISGNSSSCGCGRKQNIIGKLFGRLRVIDYVGINKHGHLLWKCECMCGEKVIVRGYILKNGSTTSCGCYHRELARERMLRENHWNWQGGISTENELVRQSATYKEWRAKIFERDDHICQMCGRRNGYVEAHHIFPFSEYKKFRFKLWNGITLCKKCHDSTKKRELELVYYFMEMRK